MRIGLGKYKTRSGAIAEITDVIDLPSEIDFNSSVPLTGLINNKRHTWYGSGEYYVGSKHDNDLMEPVTENPTPAGESTTESPDLSAPISTEEEQVTLTFIAENHRRAIEKKEDWALPLAISHCAGGHGGPDDRFITGVEAKLLRRQNLCSLAEKIMLQKIAARDPIFLAEIFDTAEEFLAYIENNVE